ncbi:S-adenosyl-L-methionine-dependent methyltransferase [Mollisia scopiformis]|uniref:S-adenosyl-L-methionine-dependent methyltransferase n=1 Tax=Mollisia scopiformis TaxID=149040 RepID=A0A194XA14_MOLSC|nr:S-adenosyl-L-methionine-dependent methyltransferase [Mollisia scopiformis]KUJ17011.1 S-adenosyl-L-methionine-dependent methyltransferase [Mollisia scopiformis]
MGRGNKRGGRGGGRGGRGRGGGSRRGGEDNRVSFDRVPKQNEKLEKYYNSVLRLSVEEKDDFWDALKRELPNSFRFAGSKGHALAVQKLLISRYIPEISKISHYDGTLVEPPKVVPWYPDDLAWWMTTPKNVVRRFPPFAAFQKYLVSETSVGNISRQEVVSMIPPLVMDLQPSMTVLDMCAAPGSKAAQLLEMVHMGEEARMRQSLRSHAKEDGREVSPDLSVSMDEADVGNDWTDNGRATGLLIANDSDYKRSHMLIHQLKRLSSPNLIVTNHDATMFPSIKLPPSAKNPAVNRYLKFDRILADVPCSGDGTTRKNVNLWQDWNPGNALGLYVTQVRILVRALQMLKPGGRVVYSTCSMNPVENEAVVASAIERCGGLDKVKLLPSDDKLPLLKRRPGLKSWSVIDKGGIMWFSHKDVEKYQDEHGVTPHTERLVPGMFPPIDGSEISQVPLENCMRVYAHLQDTGGFFIAILEKVTEFRAKPESPAKNVQTEAPITSIVDEIMSRATPENGDSVLRKIEAADALIQPSEPSNAEVAPVARQNQENTTPSSTLHARKRSVDEVEDAQVDAVMQTKKLKTKNEVDVLEPGVENVEVRRPPPPGAQLDLTKRPGDFRAEAEARPALRNRAGQQFEEPFKYISGEHPEVKVVEEFYKLSPRFPRDRFMVRNAMGEPTKTIYYTSTLIREILTENEGKGIKFIHGGVKMFMRQDVQKEGVCKWRIQSEGMPILEGYVGEERIVRLYKRSTLRKLLIEMFPKLSEGAWKDLDEIGERVRDIGMGCCVLRVEPSNEKDGFDERIVLPLWRSLHSLNLMLAKEDRTAMLLRLFNDTTPLVNNQGASKKREEVKEEDEEKPVVKSEDEDDELAVKDEDEAMQDVAPGFKVENGEIKVDTNMAIESAAPVNERPLDGIVKPGPYSSIVAEPKTGGHTDVKADKINKGEDTGGPEQQLNGTGGVEGQIGNSV